MKVQKNLPDADTMLHDIMDHRGWNVREGQRTMVNHIYGAIGNSGPSTATVGAPTGTGKSLGLLCGIYPTQRRAIITTSTKALQNQLRNSELPEFAQDVKSLYGADLQWAVLKGKSNYPCYHMLENYIKEIGAEDNLFEEADGSPDSIVKSIWAKVNESLAARDYSNLDCEDELNALPLEIRAKIVDQHCAETNRWFSSSSSVVSPEEALQQGTDCMCVYSYAYAYAMTCDIVVMNTHLAVMETEKYQFTMPSSSFERGVADLHEQDADVISQLRGTTVMAMDEAHHVPDIVSSCMSKSVCLYDIAEDLQKDIDQLTKVKSSFTPDAPRQLKSLSKSVQNMRLDGAVENNNVRNSLFMVLDEAADVVQGLLSTYRAMAEKGSMLQKLGAGPAEKWKQLASLLIGARTSMMAPLRNGWAFDAMVTESFSGHPTMGLVPMITTGFGSKTAAIMNTMNPYLKDTIVSDGRSLDDYYDDNITFICCSGTLSPSMTRMIGLPYPTHVDVPTPFDMSMCRILIPDAETVPAPPKNFRDAAGNLRRSAAIESLLSTTITAAGGRTMVLTTSNARVEEIHDYLCDSFPDLTVLRQGFGTREEQMSHFAADESSIFVGTRSFWEGVDVPGAALSHVFIDKVMFPPYNDPITSARSRFVTSNGGNAFKEISCSQAAVMMAQGVGRLIRKVGDSGLVTIADPRVADSWYAKHILELIDGDTPVTRDVNAAASWLSSCVNGDPTARDDDWMVLRGDSEPAPAPRKRGKRRDSAEVVWKK